MAGLESVCRDNGALGPGEPQHMVQNGVILSHFALKHAGHDVKSRDSHTRYILFLSTFTFHSNSPKARPSETSESYSNG
jgi:hypothetical protein